jgi:hypothetical protein
MVVLVNKFLKLINCKGKNKEVEEWKMNWIVIIKNYNGCMKWNVMGH